MKEYDQFIQNLGRCVVYWIQLAKLLGAVLIGMTKRFQNYCDKRRKGFVKSNSNNPQNFHEWLKFSTQAKAELGRNSASRLVRNININHF